MKTIYAVIALSALAALLLIRGRTATSETSPAEHEMALEMMAMPEARAVSMEPRPAVYVTQVSAGRTTPTIRTQVPARRASAASAPSVPATAKVATSTTAAPVVTSARAATPAPAATVAAPVAVRAPASARGRLTLDPASRLWFDGTSTVKDFTCKAASLEAAIATSQADAASAIVAGEKSVTSVELRVPVSRLDCTNTTMNDHMKKALGEKDHPVILFSLSSYDLATATAGVAVTLTGSLTIHGRAKAVTFVAQASRAEAGGLRLVGAHELNMKDYGVKPPSLMLGTMNVREKVKVRFDLILKD